MKRDTGLVWALDRALYFAVATGVLALLASMLVPDADAERFATAAYLAATFAAIVLAIKWFVPAIPTQSASALRLPSFPAALGFAVGLTIVLSAVVAFAPNPGAEVQLVGLSLVSIGVAAIGRAGAFTRLRVRLGRGGPLTATTRYASVAAVAALALAALLPVEVENFFAKLGYAAACVAAAGFLASVLAPASAGQWLRRTYDAGLETSGEAVFGPAIRYAVITLVAAFFVASLLPRRLGEPFAVLGYVAAAVATCCLAAECRRINRRRCASANS
jgi:hypothetical protein